MFHDNELPWRLRWYRIPGRPGFEPWVGKIPSRRKWQSTPVLLPGESQGQRSLAGYSPRGRRESDMTEWLSIGAQWTILSLSLKRLLLTFTSGYPQYLSRFLWPVFIQLMAFFSSVQQRGDGPYALILVPTREVSSPGMCANKQVLSAISLNKIQVFWLFFSLLHQSPHSPLCQGTILWFLTRRKIQVVLKTRSFWLWRSVSLLSKN